MNVSESWQGPAPGCRGSGKKPPKRSIFSCSISASPFFLGHPHSCCRATPYYRGKVPALSKSCDYQNGQPSEDLVTGWSVAVTIWRINRYRTDRSLTRTAAKIRTTNRSFAIRVEKELKYFVFSKRTQKVGTTDWAAARDRDGGWSLMRGGGC